MESAGDTVAPLNALLDPIFASAPSWPGDTSTTYNSALPADAGTTLASNMTFPTDTLARASSFSPDPNVAPLLNTTLPLASGAPAIAYSNSTNVNPFSNMSSTGFDSPGVSAAPSVANHADSAGVSIVSSMPDSSFAAYAGGGQSNAPTYAYPDSSSVSNYNAMNSHASEIVQTPQSSSNLGADSIVPTNWSSSDTTVSGGDVAAQQQAMQMNSQPPSSLQAQISSTPGAAAAPLPRPYVSNQQAPQQYAKPQSSSSFAAPHYGTDFFQTALAAAALRRMGAVSRAKETAGEEPTPKPIPHSAKSVAPAPSAMAPSPQPPSPKPVEQLAKNATPSTTGNRLNSALGSAGSSRSQSMEAARDLLGRLNIAADPTIASPLSSESEPVSPSCTNCTGLMCNCMGGNRTLAQRFARKSNNVEVAMPPLTTDV